MWNISIICVAREITNGARYKRTTEYFNYLCRQREITNGAKCTRTTEYFNYLCSEKDNKWCKI